MIKKLDLLLGFKILYLIHVFLAFNCFTFHMKFLDYTSVVVIVLGGILLLQRVKNIKYILTYKYVWILILFFVSYAISLIVNWKYGFMGNIKGGVWMTLQFFLLYVLEPEKYDGEYKMQLKIISSVLIVYTAFCSLVGMLMAFFSYGGREDFLDGTGTFYGFIWGRLWGCYTDPNHGGIITVVAVFLAFYLLYYVQKKYIRLGLWISIFFNYLYLVFSDSRSAKLSFTLGCMLLLFFNLRGNAKEINIKKMLIQILVSACAALCIYVSFTGVKMLYNTCVMYMTETEDDHTKEIGREEDIEGDYSNRRFDIWTSGVEIYEENPVAGIGFRNVISYAESDMPDTYIVNNDYAKFDSFHNVVIDVLVSQGTIGILLLLILGLAVFIKSMVSMIKEKRFSDIECRTLFCIVLILVIDSMFISAIFYVNSPETVAFWALLGYFIYFLHGKGENNVRIEAENRSPLRR